MVMATIVSFLKYFYQCFTVSWLFISPATYFFDAALFKKWYYYVFLLFFVLIISSISYFSISKIEHKIKSLDCQIEVVFDDILSLKRRTIVIPVNDVFDTELGETISLNSVQGQFTQKIFDNDVAKLDQTIENELRYYNGERIVDSTKKYGKNVRYPIGTIIKVGNNPKYILLVSARMEAEKKKARKITIDELWENLSSLWEFNKSFNSIDDICLPVIGTGFGRINSNIINVAKMIIVSFYSKSREEKIANKLTLVIKRGNDKAFAIHELALFIKALS
jgi:hypothetical protein